MRKFLNYCSKVVEGDELLFNVFFAFLICASIGLYQTVNIDCLYLKSYLKFL